MPKTRGFRDFVMRAALFAVVAFAPRVAAAELRPFHGTLRFLIGSLDTIAIDGDGIADASLAPLGTSIQHVDVDAGVFSETGITRTVDPANFPIAGVRASAANQAGAFERSGPGNHLHGVMPISGVARVCLFAACDESPLANLSIPLSIIGAGGTVTATDEVNLTVRGAPWTTGTIRIPTSSGYSFFVRGTSQGTGWSRATSLVTPIFISSNLGASPVIASWATLDLDFSDPCSDGRDNDGDGKTDHPDDPGCSAPEDREETDPTLPCDDGIDNDGDLLTDIFYLATGVSPWFPPGRDTGCAAWNDSNEIEACSDGLDDDADGRIDMADSGCTDPLDNDEYALPACSDLADNDGDGERDAEDPGCASPSDEDEHGTAVCDDGVDQDGDGVADLPGDPGCSDFADSSEQSASVACDDGDDDDGDGLVDHADPGCVGSADPDEHASAMACDDGVDQDGDTLVDFPADGDCAAAGDAVEGPDVAACQNGIDDDADGLIDAVDPACTGPDDPEEAILLADGATHIIDAASSQPAESIRVADGPGAAQTRLQLGQAGVVGHRLVAENHSFVSIAGGTLGGDLSAIDQAAVEVESGSLAGTIRTQDVASVLLRGGPVSGALEVRGNSQLTILGWVPNRVGTVPQLGGTITGTLADGTPVNLAFLREPSATITIPEPGVALAQAIALAAVAALAWRPSGRPRG